MKNVPESFLSKVVMVATALVILSGCAATAQEHVAAVGANWTYIHSNVLPNCNCFGMQGGSGELQVGLAPRVSLLGDITVTHRGGLSPDGYALTQSVFSAGLRFRPVHARVEPFGDLLLGAAHAGGSLSPAKTGFGSGNAFAFQAGGGVFVPLSARWTLKPVQVNYLLTTFANGANNRQNDVRVSAGFDFRIRR